MYHQEPGQGQIPLSRPTKQQIVLQISLRHDYVQTASITGQPPVLSFFFLGSRRKSLRQIGKVKQTTNRRKGNLKKRERERGTETANAKTGIIITSQEPEVCFTRKSSESNQTDRTQKHAHQTRTIKTITTTTITTAQTARAVHEVADGYCEESLHKYVRAVCREKR